MSVSIEALLLALSFFALMCAIIIMHECLHILGFYLLKIDFKIKIVTFYKLPVAIGIFSEYFKGSFSELTTKKKYEYFFIAIIPYIIIIPFLYFLSNLGILFFGIFAIVMIITHLINFPLEFINTETYTKKPVKKVKIK